MCERSSTGDPGGAHSDPPRASLPPTIASRLAANAQNPRLYETRIIYLAS
jgi:hypothetical protein